jgi:DNA mismatch repair protein MutL
MARRIRILPDGVANQIAAGEVVERPASVVKELVENAIDAGARDIRVELVHGGKRSIRVADDGSGMDREDALLSLDRHATSKISGAEDLRSIATFGFRGEALPAIASVSRMTLESCLNGEESGTRILLRGGVITAVEDTARTPGTTVLVEGLFFNAPARGKFLRKPPAETRAVTEALTPIALANPQVGLTLVSDERALMELPAASDVVDRIVALWGEEVCRTAASRRARAGGDYGPRSHPAPGCSPARVFVERISSPVIVRSGSPLFSALQTVATEPPFRRSTGRGSSSSWKHRLEEWM